MSEVTTVTGVPQLALVVGSGAGSASYLSGSGTTSLVFRYTAVLGDTDTDGISMLADQLSLNSGTMAMAVNVAYGGNKRRTAILMGATALLGASFVGMQVFEWSKLISEGVRPWGNPMGASQFGSVFFMITGFHGLHVSAGVIYLAVVARKVARGDYEKKGYAIVEITGLYWHFVDLVWVFIFAFFYLW